MFKTVNRTSIENSVMEAIKEDKAFFDITTQMCIPQDAEGAGVISAKEDGVLAGIQTAEVVMQNFGTYVVEYLHEDGDEVKSSESILRIKGKMRGIISGERIILNYMQRLCGIATFTRKMVKLTEHTNTKILDTRKTTPGLRLLEKYAVMCGGAVNHRMDLFDQIMIKDNHIAMMDGELSVINRMKNKYPDKYIVVEVDRPEQIEYVLQFPVDRLLLDNMNPDQISECLKIIANRCEVEVSGNINEKNIKNYLIDGVGYISIGKLTHSFKSLDLSMRVENV